MAVLHEHSVSSTIPSPKHLQTRVTSPESHLGAPGQRSSHSTRVGLPSRALDAPAVQAVPRVAERTRSLFVGSPGTGGAWQRQFISIGELVNPTESHVTTGSIGLACPRPGFPARWPRSAITPRAPVLVDRRWKTFGRTSGQDRTKWSSLSPGHPTGRPTPRTTRIVERNHGVAFEKPYPSQAAGPFGTVRAPAR